MIEYYRVLATLPSYSSSLWWVSNLNFNLSLLRSLQEKSDWALISNTHIHSPTSRLNSATNIHIIYSRSDERCECSIQVNFQRKRCLSEIFCKKLKPKASSSGRYFQQYNVRFRVVNVFFEIIMYLRTENGAKFFVFRSYSYLESYVKNINRNITVLTLTWRYFEPFVCQ